MPVDFKIPVVGFKMPVPVVGFKNPFLPVVGFKMPVSVKIPVGFKIG